MLIGWACIQCIFLSKFLSAVPQSLGHHRPVQVNRSSRTLSTFLLVANSFLISFRIFYTPFLSADCFHFFISLFSERSSSLSFSSNSSCFSFSIYLFLLFPASWTLYLLFLFFLLFPLLHLSLLLIIFLLLSLHPFLSLSICPPLLFSNSTLFLKSSSLREIERFAQKWILNPMIQALTHAFAYSTHFTYILHSTKVHIM